jgi:hypothetical protein
VRLSRKRKSPTKRSKQTPKRIRKTDESSAADALLMLMSCPAETVSNEEGYFESEPALEPACSTEDFSTTALQHDSKETQVNIFVSTVRNW